MYVYSAYDRKSKYPGEADTASVAGCRSVAAEARLCNRRTVSEIVLRTVVRDVILRVANTTSHKAEEQMQHMNEK